MSISLLNVPAPPPVAPSECALVIAIPLDERGFLGDPETGIQSNFAQVYCENFDGDREAAWQAYQRYAELALHVVDEVQRLGVTVRERASLEDFHDALSRFKVTTLVAQWRDARFLPEDIADPELALRTLNGSIHVSPASDPAALAFALNGLIGVLDSPAGPSRKPTRAETTQTQYDWYRRRREFESRHAGVTRGGAGVEFRSGFRTVEEILRGISPAFAETLDLTVCQSVLLGEEVRRRCPGCSVLVNADLTSFDLRFACYHQTVSIIHQHPQPWEDAAVSIRKALLTYGQHKRR